MEVGEISRGFGGGLGVVVWEGCAQGGYRKWVQGFDQGGSGRTVESYS